MVASPQEVAEAAARIASLKLRWNNLTLEAIISELRAGATINPTSAAPEVRAAVAAVTEQLDAGTLRVAEKSSGHWVVHEWVKKAVLLSFRLSDNAPMQGGFAQFYDKVPNKFATWDQATFARSGVRVVPPAVARHGSFVAKNVVMMPSFVNIGA